MRVLVLLGVISLTAGGDALAQKRITKPVASKPSPRPATVARPVFSFLGDDTETPTTRKDLNAKACTTTGAVMECDDHSNPKIGGADLKWLSLSYNGGLLHQVIGATWTNRYATLLEAFTAKYGTPKIEVRKWQARSGATFDNAVATWQFKGGFLELSALGTDVNSALFMFVSTANAPAKEKPKVDF